MHMFLRHATQTGLYLTKNCFLINTVLIPSREYIYLVRIWDYIILINIISALFLSVNFLSFLPSFFPSYKSILIQDLILLMDSVIRCIVLENIYDFNRRFQYKNWVLVCIFTGLEDYVVFYKSYYLLIALHFEVNYFGFTTFCSCHFMLGNCGHCLPPRLLRWFNEAIVRVIFAQV